MNYDTQLLNSRLWNDQIKQNIRTGRLRVSPYEIERLLEVRIEQKINEHSSLYFRGILPEDSKISYAEIPSQGTNVILSYLDEFEEEHVLYQGVVRNVVIEAVGKGYHLIVQALSYSFLLDIHKKSRSFQNKSASYTDLIRQVTAAYPGGAVIDVVTNGQATNEFIIQHLETDWEFLKRLASRFNSGLICDIRFDTPCYYFGIPEEQSMELDGEDYWVKKDAEKYYLMSENSVPDLRETDSTIYEIKTNLIAKIGDAVSTQGKQLYVAQVNYIADDDMMDSYLLLTTKRGLSQPRIPNHKIIGASFGGHIILASNDVVKVALDIDRDHDSGEPCFFPYSTVYSSQDGSGWYCMPEIGDRVRIYCPDYEDDHAFALSSVHEQVDPALLQPGDPEAKAAGGGGVQASGATGSYSGMRDAPEVKSMTYGDKEVRLTPEGVYIITADSVITLTDGGILVMSDNDITIKSEKSIVVSAEDEVSIFGSEGAALMCDETTGVVVKDDVQVIGQEVKAN